MTSLMASERQNNHSSVVVVPEQWEDEIMPLQGNMVGTSTASGRATMTDTRIEQLMAQIEELVDPPQKTRKGEVTSRQNLIKVEEGEADRSSQSTKSNCSGNDGHSRRIPRGYGSSGDTRSTDEQTAKRRKGAGGWPPLKMRNRDYRSEIVDLVRQNGRSND
ncbi:hypothetical protein FNV43_RR04079 [Rhamnella rubrinervis]|uniref:Uncharacterized protein n=1 Tax=Rhamnella rubrinervis TaxID=2594499 RepID=A0A8K0MPW8_9ROSA|nr:hypothetical protein FNV43_RR04079 [Rhamnella rubrinervis]